MTARIPHTSIELVIDILDLVRPNDARGRWYHEKTGKRTGMRPLTLGWSSLVFSDCFLTLQYVAKSRLSIADLASVCYHSKGD